MNANKLFSEFSLKKIWDKLLQHDKAMNSTLLVLSSGNWEEQEDGTFKNTVSYSSFKETDKLTVDVYDDGNLSETALTEYEQYIDEFDTINGALVATANTKPTQTMTIVVKGDFEVDAVVGDITQLIEDISQLNEEQSNQNERINELSSNVNERLPFKLGIDTNGNYGYIKDGADTVTPFKTGNEYKNIIVDSLANTKKGLTYNSSWEDIARVINECFPDQLNLLSKWGVSEVYKMPTWWDEPITWYSEDFDITNFSTLQRTVTYGWTSGSGTKYGACSCTLITDQGSVSLLGSGGVNVSGYSGMARIQIIVGGAKPWKPTSNSTTRAWAKITSLVLYA